MIRGLGQNLAIQVKISHKFIIMKIVSVCLYNTIVNAGIMLISLSWILALYLTPVTKVDGTFKSVMLVNYQFMTYQVFGKIFI